jgi:hypothetical protein
MLVKFHSTIIHRPVFVTVNNWDIATLFFLISSTAFHTFRQIFSYLQPEELADKELEPSLAHMQRPQAGIWRNRRNNSSKNK